MTPPRTKICGLTKEGAVLAAREAGADFMGFVFYPPSPRHVSPARAAELSAQAPELPSVAVTVDASDDMLTSIVKLLRPHYLQLHGTESPQRVEHIKQRFQLPVIKAIPISASADFAIAADYEHCADMLLFDAKVPKGLPGGNGLSFDWALLQTVHFSIPWFLSGGLTADNVEEAVRISGARLLDASSSLESAPGEKSPAKIRAFLEIIKTL